MWNSEHPNPHNNSYSIYFGSHHEKVKYLRFCKFSYICYSLWLLSRSLSFIPTWPFEIQWIQTVTTIHTVYILGLTKIGLNTGVVWVFFIYLIVSGCCIGPKPSSQLDRLKMRPSKFSQQFIQCIFWVPPRMGYIWGGCVTDCNILWHTVTHCNTLQHTLTHTYTQTVTHTVICM